MTIRTQADLLALYADNATGDISAQDLRDLVDTYFQPRTLWVHASLIARETGPGRPVAAAIGPTGYSAFTVGDDFNPHLTLPKDFDPTQDIIVHVDWFPVLSEAGKTASWDLDYKAFHDNSATLDVADGTLQIVSAAVPILAYESVSSTFTIPAVNIDPLDHELMLRLERKAATDDPTTLGVHHIWAEVITKLAGAT